MVLIDRRTAILAYNEIRWMQHSAARYTKIAVNMVKISKFYLSKLFFCSESAFSENIFVDFIAKSTYVAKSTTDRIPFQLISVIPKTTKTE